MKNRIHTLILGTALVGVLALCVVGCEKTPSGIGEPPPPTSVGTEMDDSVITSSVKAALIADPDIKSYDFKVETRKGEVLLSGFVNNQRQSDRAMQIARGIQGVHKVTDKMVIKQ